MINKQILPSNCNNNIATVYKRPSVLVSNNRNAVLYKKYGIHQLMSLMDIGPVALGFFIES